MNRPVRRFAGIDPGITGAIAVVDEFGRLVATADIPTAGDGKRRMVSGALLAEALRVWRPDEVVIERVGAMPGQGVSSTFRFGRALGIIEGVAGALGLPVSYVSATVWKKHLRLPSDKEAARQKAVEIWPSHAAIHFARRRDHGRAEAALIGLWYARAAAIASGAPMQPPETETAAPAGTGGADAAA
jgi:crossover junction endodeoxyribonuclease RuvC